MTLWWVDLCCKYTQVRTILDMHHINICSSLDWYICHVCGTQTEEWAMELWHKSGDMVRWSVLWVCHCRSSMFICDPQILLCTSGTCPTLLSLWVLLVCLHSSPGELLLLKFSPFFESIEAVAFSSLDPVFWFVQCMSVVPLDIFRWVIAGVAGFMSATFVALNLRAHIMSAGERWFFIVAGIFVLQLALAVVLKFYLFTVSVWEELLSRNGAIKAKIKKQREMFLAFISTLILCSWNIFYRLNF